MPWRVHACVKEETRELLVCLVGHIKARPRQGKFERPSEEQVKQKATHASSLTGVLTRIERVSWAFDHNHTQ